MLLFKKKEEKKRSTLPDAWTTSSISSTGFLLPLYLLNLSSSSLPSKLVTIQHFPFNWFYSPKAHNKPPPWLHFPVSPPGLFLCCHAHLAHHVSFSFSKLFLKQIPSVRPIKPYSSSYSRSIQVTNPTRYMYVLLAKVAITVIFVLFLPPPYWSLYHLITLCSNLRPDTASWSVVTELYSQMEPHWPQWASTWTQQSALISLLVPWTGILSFVSKVHCPQWYWINKKQQTLMLILKSSCFWS